MPKIILISRCAWTLFNFRAGQLRFLKEQENYLVMGAGAGGDGFEPKIEALGVPFILLPIDKKGLNPRADLGLIGTLFGFYRRERPHIVHHFTIKPVIYGSLAARLAGVPRIVNTVTGLGYVFTENNRRWLRRVVEMQYRLALACAHHTFFQNRDDLEMFLNLRFINPRKVGLLPGSGVDTEYFAPQSSEEAADPHAPVIFLMIARLLRDKGVYEFVEAARRVKAQHPEARFQLLGSRDERNPTVVAAVDLEAWVSEGIVEWLGQVEDVRSSIAKADVVTLPSYREGTPRSLLEAASMGKPLITTDVPGCREVVEEGINGFLVPAKDAEALAGAMLRMIANPEGRRLMGCAGREKVQREFQESSVIQRVMQSYHPEINEGAGPRAVIR